MRLLPFGRRVGRRALAHTTVRAASATGKRKDNQDNYLIVNVEGGQGIAQFLQAGGERRRVLGDWHPDFVRLAVADGVGGHDGGRQMSEAVVAALAELPPLRAPKAMRAALLQLHRRMLDRFADGSTRCPATTLVMADLDCATGAGVLLNLGDSRAYVVGRAKPRQVTYDHTVPEFAWRDRKINDRDYQQCLAAGNQRLTQALGWGSWGLFHDGRQAVDELFDHRVRLDLAPPESRFGKKEAENHADVFGFRLCDGDGLLLASDGRGDAADVDGWCLPCAAAFHNPNGPQALVRKALESGSRDNVTVTICSRTPGPANDRKP